MCDLTPQRFILKLLGGASHLGLWPGGRQMAVKVYRGIQSRAWHTFVSYVPNSARTEIPLEVNPPCLKNGFLGGSLFTSVLYYFLPEDRMIHHLEFFYFCASRVKNASSAFLDQIKGINLFQLSISHNSQLDTLAKVTSSKFTVRVTNINN